jgi:hypothetical protein
MDGRKLAQLGSNDTETKVICGKCHLARFNFKWLKENYINIKK